MTKLGMSFGGGVQSSAVAQLVLEGELPRPDVWVFADTGNEPLSVYENIANWSRRLNDAGMEFVYVAKLNAASLGDKQRELAYEGRTELPWWVATNDGKHMPLRRGCTRAFKVRPIMKFLRRWGEVPRGYKGPPLITEWLGISYDEMQRMRDSEDPWIEYAYPLVDLKLTRTDCLGILKRAHRETVRSACIFCPFHSDLEWERLKQDEPLEFGQAVAFEQEIQTLWKSARARNKGALENMPFLHKSGRPLDSIDFTKQQPSLFHNMDNECFGRCGV